MTVPMRRAFRSGDVVEIVGEPLHNDDPTIAPPYPGIGARGRVLYETDDGYVVVDWDCGMTTELGPMGVLRHVEADP